MFQRIQVCLFDCLSVYLSGAALVIWLKLLLSHLNPCHLMHLLSLLELAFGQPFFNHMHAGVCVPLWVSSCYLIEVIVITFKLLSSHAYLVFVRAGLRFV